MRFAATLLATLSASALCGCCAFVPCHPGTWIVVKVTSSQGAPVAGARVSLYGTADIANAQGCLVMHRASAIPLSISVAASGYKTVEEPARFGFYRVNVKLSQNHSAETGVVYWNSISEQEFKSSQQCE